jgi:hypothetical protein
MLLSETFLHWTETIKRAGKPLNGGDFVSVRLYCEDGAAFDGLSI